MRIRGGAREHQQVCVWKGQGTSQRNQSDRTIFGRKKETQRMGVAETQLFSGSKLQRKRKEGTEDRWHLSMSERRGGPEWEEAPQTQL